MNHKNLELIKKWSIHLIFCVIFLFYFGYNCNLRPVAYPYIYKEFLTGLITLVFIYLNYLLLFPRLYVIRKYKAFWLLTICSIVISGCLEMLLVYPEVREIYIQSGEISHLKSNLIDDLFHVTIRNGGWVLFSIVISETLKLKKREQSKENALRKQCDFLDVHDLGYKNGFINIKDIYYCEQNQNMVTIHTVNKEEYFRYCSMKRMEELLGPEEFTRISRNAIVAKKFIYKYSNDQLKLRKIDNFSDTKTLWVGKEYENQLKEQLQLTVDGKSGHGLSTEKKNPQKKEKGKDLIQKNKTILEEFNKNPKLMAVYLHIKKNPNCNVNNISAKCRLPKGSVKRYITFLMNKHLIQHTGSRRYGGYSVVSQD